MSAAADCTRHYGGAHVAVSMASLKQGQRRHRCRQRSRKPDRPAVTAAGTPLKH